MIGLVDAIARRLVRRGLRRGLIEGSPIWLTVALVALVVRLLVRPETEKVVRERLRLGETLTVRHLPAPTPRRGSTPAADR